jgi:hypothetical protein
MSSHFFGSGLLGIAPPVRHKIFVSFHHASDQAYCDAFSRAFHDKHEVIYDNSFESQIDSENVDYVMRRVRENHIHGTSCALVLVGANTWGCRYVDWEIYATLEKQHALIGVQLSTAPIDANGRVSVPSRLNDNIRSGYTHWLRWQQVTSSADQLERHIAEDKAQEKRLIVNTR